MLRLRHPAILALLAAPLAAQEPVTYVVRNAGVEVGRETLRRERSADGGSSLLVEAQYPQGRLRLSGTLQRDASGVLVSFRLRLEGPDGPVSVMAASSGQRLVLRTESRAGESGREVPAARDVLILDENLLSLLAAVGERAGPTGTRLTAVWPRSGRRASFVATRTDRTVVLTGDLVGTLTLDEAGAMVRLELPAQGLTATAVR